jgi:hypothetical protein
MTVYAPTLYALQSYIDIAYDLILTLFGNIRICFEILAWTGFYLKGVSKY